MSKSGGSGFENLPDHRETSPIFFSLFKSKNEFFLIFVFVVFCRCFEVGQELLSFTLGFASNGAEIMTSLSNFYADGFRRCLYESFRTYNLCNTLVSFLIVSFIRGRALSKLPVSMDQISLMEGRGPGVVIEFPTRPVGLH